MFENCSRKLNDDWEWGWHVRENVYHFSLQRLVAEDLSRRRQRRGGVKNSDIVTTGRHFVETKQGGGEVIADAS
jgi:hypothetical protein